MSPHFMILESHMEKILLYHEDIFKINNVGLFLKSSSIIKYIIKIHNSMYFKVHFTTILKNCL